MNDKLANQVEFHTSTVEQSLPEAEATTLVPSQEQETLVQTDEETGEKDSVAVM